MRKHSSVVEQSRAEPRTKPPGGNLAIAYQYVEIFPFDVSAKYIGWAAGQPFPQSQGVSASFRLKSW